MNRAKEAYNAYMRDYRKKNSGKMREYKREYNRAWREKNGYHNENRWRALHPVAVRAERATQYAMSAGKLAYLPCAVCGAEKTVAHHPNYRRPLKVVFLCYPHHREYHYRAWKNIR